MARRSSNQVMGTRGAMMHTPAKAHSANQSMATRAPIPTPPSPGIPDPMQMVTILQAQPTAAPPKVADASAIGATLDHYAAQDHTHAGVNLDAAQTISGAKRFDGNVGFFKAVVGQQAALASVTGTVGGTTNGAMESIPNPADTPADADTLRDDLVTNVLPTLRNNIQELLVSSNKALDTLRVFGFIAT